MWNVLVFESLSGSGSFIVDVLVSEIGFVAASGTIFSAILEMGSRAWTSLTEAKPRVKRAGRTAVVWVLAAIVDVVLLKRILPVRRIARRVSARVQAIVEVCGVEIVGCLGDQDVAFIEVVRPEVKWRANHIRPEISRSVPKSSE
jgi:hypothetical protein